MKIPDVMTRRPTADESRTASRRLLDAGAYAPEVDMPIRLRRWRDGEVISMIESGNLTGLVLVTSAALLDATEELTSYKRHAADLEALLDAVRAERDRLRKPGAVTR